MFCHKCGEQLPEDTGFCHKCGAKLTDDNQEKQTEESGGGAGCFSITVGAILAIVIPIFIFGGCQSC